MSNQFDRDDLKSLITQPEGLCVSLLMPAHPAGLEWQQQDQIRLRNLVRKAEKSLLEGNFAMRSPDIDRLLAPVQRILQQNADFWQHVNKGLAIFLSHDFHRIYHLPVEFEETLVIARHFYIRPLLPLLSEDGRFFILALSQKDVRLLEATRDTVTAIQLDNVPRSVEEAVRWDNLERQIQFHTGTGASTAAGRSAIFHGHGIGSAELRKADLTRFVQAVGNGLQRNLAGRQAPLVLAGVEYILSLYRDVNQYPHLLGVTVAGNPDRLSESELQRRAWPIVQSHFQKVARLAVDQYEELAGSRQASNYIREVLPAAREGRVATLLVADDGQQWGTYDQNTGHISLMEEEGPSAEDLFNLAAIHTILHGGTVQVLNKEELSEKTGIAAIMRY